MRKIIKMPSVENVTSGATCTGSLPVGLTYDILYVSLTNITLAQLTNIEIRANGKTIQEFETGTVLDAINQYHGRREFTNGVLPIYFMRPELNLPIEQRMTALGTSDLSTLSFHADIDAGCSNPAMDIRAQLSAAEPMGVITKIRRFPRAAAAAGEFEFSNAPKLGRIMAVHFKKTADDVSHVLIKVDGRETMDASKTVLAEVAAGFGKTEQTYYTHVDYCLNGMLQDSLVTKNVQDLSMRPTLDTSGALDIIIEYLAGYTEEG